MDAANKQSRIAKWKSLNFRGSSDWAIDLQGDPGAVDDREVVYLDPAVYTGTPAQCSPPCLFVFPPGSLSQPTTISIPPYTTSIQLSKGATTTITVTVTQLTVTSLSYSNLNISTGQNTGTLHPYVSLDVPPVTTVIDGETRTLRLPPWPAITRGPPASWDSGNPGSGNPGSGTSGTGTFGNGTYFPGFPLPTAPDNPPSESIPTTTKPPFSIPTTIDPSVPVWPYFDLEPVPTPVPEEGEDDDDEDGKSKSTCKLWFFFVCISWGDDWNINIQGWEWDFPVGVWGPGPPPIDRIRLPPGFTIKGSLPPWPRITVPPKGPIEAPPKPTDCTPAEASLCLTTTSFATTVTGGETRTTSSQVKSRCETITGCNFRNVEVTKTVDACTLQKRTLELTEWLEPTAGPQGTLPLVKRTTLQVRAEPDWMNCGESPGPDGILWPQARSDSTQQATRAILERRKLALGHDFIEFRANDLDFTAFYYVYNMGPVALAYFNSAEVPSVLLAYYPSNPFLPPGISFKRDVSDESSFNETYVFDEPSLRETSSFETWNAPLRKLNHEKSGSGLKHSGIDKTFDAPGIDIRDNVEIRDVVGNATEPEHVLGKRTVGDWFNAAWHLSMLTWPPAVPFNVPRDIRNHGSDPHDPDHNPPGEKYAITADDSWGQGQTVYIMDSGWDKTAAEYSARADELPFKTYGRMPDQSNEKVHGSRTTAFAAGNALGMAKKARIRFAQVPTKTRSDNTPSLNQGEIVERFLEALINIANDAATQPKDTCVVNMSWGIPPRYPVQRHYWSIFVSLMQAMETKYGCVFVAAPGNSGQEARHYPALLWDKVPGMFVAGAVDIQGFPFSGNSGEDIINIYAPGVKVPLGSGNWVTGTSYAAPIVAGFVAYLRGLPQYTGGRDPTSILAKIQEWARPITIEPLLADADDTSGYNILWNGQQFGTNCVSLTKRGIFERQIEVGDEDGGSCPIRGDPSSPGGPDSPSNPGGNGPQGPPVEYKSGEPGPICSTNCGKLCSGFYCNPTPTGTPPDFTPPRTTTKPTSTAAPTSCTGLSTLHTTTLCNGDPRGGSCKTSTLCEGALPTLPPQETPPPIPSNCASTTTWTSCALGLPPGASACITSSSCAATSTTDPPANPTTTPTTSSTWSPPYGLPTPHAVPGTSSSCIKDNCGLYPSIMDACDKAAEVFIKLPNGPYGTGEDDFLGTCIDGTDSSNGKPVGCSLQFLVREDHIDNTCHWTGSGAAQWYSNLRSSCETCGLLEDTETGCTLWMEFVERCDDIHERRIRSLQ